MKIQVLNKMMLSMQCNSRPGKGFFLIVAVALLFSACKQPPANTVLSADDNGGYASDASRIQLFTDDAISLMDVAGNFYNSTYIANPTLATVTVDTGNFPGDPSLHLLQIIFNANTDATCLDGRKRKGSISVSYYGRYSDTGSMHIHSIQFDNYFVDDYQVSGSIQYIRVDTTVIGNWYYQVTVNDTVTLSPGNYDIWKGTLVRKWITGDSSGNRNDDVYSISGNATLTRPNAHQFAFGIATPLQVAINYNFVESGVVNVSGRDGVRVLNYGNGTPDNIASVNIGVNSYSILLNY